MKIRVSCKEIRDEKRDKEDIETLRVKKKN